MHASHTPVRTPVRRDLKDYAVRVVNPNQAPVEYVTRAESSSAACAADHRGVLGGFVSAKVVRP